MSSIHYQGRRYGVEPGESVLQALLRQGAPVNHSCRNGSCHTCALKCEHGEVRHSRSIDPAIQRDGHILCCVAIPQGDLVLAPPDLDQMSVPAEVVGRRQLAADVVELAIAPAQEMVFRAGQHMQLLRDDGLCRSYSIASLPGEEYFFRIQVRHVAGGAMSRWLCEEVQIGQVIAVRRPMGECCYAEAMRGRALLMLATGTGVGAMAAVARQALAYCHTAPITLYHGGKRRADLYLHAELLALSGRHANFHYVPCVSAETADDGMHVGRVTDVAFSDWSGREAAEVFLCGHPSMVQEARYRAVLAGARHEYIHADAFDFSHPPLPRDAQKIAATVADPELWQALEQGPGLTRILTTFYDRVYADARLSPFFQSVPKAYVIQKQYEFLANLFTRTTGYSGFNPYNAHHWMVISDELFDHREALFESALLDYGLAPALIRRWMALQELFRADMVKPASRGIISQGVEQPLRTHVVERLDIDTICDGCNQPIPAGLPSRYQFRIGSLHCAACAGIELSYSA